MSRRIIIFFGPPGSGKGTQSDLLATTLKLPVVSAGELLRAEQNAGTKIGKQVSAIIDQGKMAPNDLVFKLVRQRLQGERRGFILDGFPRNLAQAPDLLKLAKPADKIVTIVIEVSDRETKRRIVLRRVCDCGVTYHLHFNPPKKLGRCDNCGNKLYQRRDDTPAVISRRLRDYRRRLPRLLAYLQKHGAVVKINGEQTIKQVQSDITKYVTRNTSRLCRGLTI